MKYIMFGVIGSLAALFLAPILVAAGTKVKQWWEEQNRQLEQMDETEEETE